jgi:hypothetical protein
MIAAMGKNGQFINVVPSQNLVMIRMGETPGQSLDVEVLYNNEIWENFNKIMCGITAMKETIKPEIKIYPNPSNGKTTIRVPGENFHLELRNISGKSIINQQNCNEQAVFNTEGLTPGIYFLKLSNSTGLNIMQKLIIQ